MYSGCVMSSRLFPFSAIRGAFLFGFVSGLATAGPFCYLVRHIARSLELGFSSRRRSLPYFVSSLYNIVIVSFWCGASHHGASIPLRCDVLDS